uniref:Cleavage/polyadenylation specificity factor A subunit C-terminal domain-containing protein n=1 Tax=Compsopogon caeruleus TaxID=31354 RepID=A0A7S1TF12_9RHOD|mmetsp:Transcript_4166/g.8031  ORF Transcript_4166/g.8031 Transcript_4166/m.8031 type:complete len:848 (+) Transcript_4166:2574-5117(+)
MERPYEEFDAGTMEDFGLGNSSNAEVQLTVEIEVLVELKPTEERIVATAQIHRGRLGRLAIQLDASEQHRLHLALERRKVGSGYWDDMDDIERMLYADAGMSITSSMGGKALVQDREVEAVMDDEEMMLYSESKAREEHKDLDKTGNHVSMPEKHVNHVIAIAYTDSCFELRSLPIFSEILFATTDLHLGLRTLYPTGNIDLPSTSFGNRTSSSKIAHMHLCQLNNASALDGELPASLCLVLVTSDGRLLLYRTALQMEFNREGKPYFAISLHRIILQIVPELCHDEESISSVKEWGLIPFYDLGGRSGLLMNVPNPLIITLDRGYPRVHAFSIENEDKAILWMVPFHNVNCHKGAIAILPGGGVCVCSLPSNNQISLETSWVQRKVNARANVRKIAYHSSSESYVALASSEEEISSADMRRRILALSSAKNATAEARVELDEERLPLEIIEKHEIRLYQPGSWSLVKTYSLGENEAGLAVASMALDVYKQPKQADQDEEQQKRQQQDGGEMAVSPFAVTERLKSKHLVVVGTGYLKGEDANIRGRLLVFEISRQEGFSGLGQFSRFQLQLIAEKELKGPVSSLSTVQGYIACGVGPKVELHKLVEDEIVCTCFFFADLYTSSLSTLKQYILVGDMMKSVSLVYWRERNKSMTLLGKDFETARVYSTDFLIDGDELSLIFSDSEGNIHMINYGGISDPDARGGERLVPRGSYSLGARIGNFRRVGLTEKGDNHVTLFVTLDGAIGGIVPVPPRDFKKIRALQGKLVNLDELPRYAGINPGRMHDLVSEPFGNGTYRPSGQHLTNGRLLGEFRFLTEARQIEITRQVGLSPSSVSRQLQYLDQILSRF